MSTSQQRREDEKAQRRETLIDAAEQALAGFDGEVVVTYGDVPMLTSETLADLVADHRAQQAAVTVLTGATALSFGLMVRPRD